ncbi:putative oligo-1,6-glucosidase 2 [compost metagenome]
MQWNAGVNAGFSSGEPWIKVNPNYREINVEQAEKDPASVLTFYRKLIAMRRKHPVMVYGQFIDLSGDDPHLYIYKRSYEKIDWIVMLNHGTEEQAVTLLAHAHREGSAGLSLLLGNYQETPEACSLSDTITLRPFEARIYEVRQ